MNWINFLTQDNVPLFSSKTTLQEALDNTVETRHKTGVFIEDGKVIGIITERDIIKSFISGIPSDKAAIDYGVRSVITIRQSRSVEYALGIVMSKNLKRAPVVDDNGGYVGLLTHDTLLGYFEVKNDGMKQKAINLIQGKSLITAKTTDSLSYVASIMYKNKIGLLPLTFSHQVVGIISESDILRLIQRSVSFDLAAGEYMNTDILFAEEDSYSDDVLGLMDERKVSHILVKGKNGEAIGALSKRDLIRNLKDNYQKILEKKLKNARDALSKLPNPIIELCRSDESYYVSWCNAKAEEAVGGSLFDLKITDVVKDEKFAATISLCAANGGAHSCVTSFNGRVYEIMCCRLDEHSMQLLFNDLTEVKKSEEYLRALIDFLPEMIVVSDGVDMILCNQSLLKFSRVKSFEEFKDTYKCICN